MSRRLLVTGGTGYIGRHCLPLLVAAGYDVHAVSRTPPKVGGHVTWHVADLLDPGTLVERLRPELLFHLAWYVEHGDFWESSENLRWLRASLRLFRDFSRHGGRRIVTAGTCAEPVSAYGRAKHALLIADDLPSCAWAEIHHLYGGKGEDTRRFVPTVFRALLAGEQPRVDAQTVDDFAPVVDVAAALVALLNGDKVGRIPLRCGSRTTLDFLARRMHELVHDIASPDTPFDAGLRDALAHARLAP